MSPRASDDPAVAALGRTLAVIARPDFRLRDVLQSVVEEAAALGRADSADIAIPDGAGFSTATTAYAVRACVAAPGT